MRKNDVVTVVTLSGEYIGKFESLDAGVVTLKDPRMLIHGEQGVGFARGICMTSDENTRSVVFQQYVFITATNDDFAKAYIQSTSGIIL